MRKGCLSVPVTLPDLVNCIGRHSGRPGDGAQPSATTRAWCSQHRFWHLLYWAPKVPLALFRLPRGPHQAFAPRSGFAQCRLSRRTTCVVYRDIPRGFDQRPVSKA